MIYKNFLKIFLNPLIWLKPLFLILSAIVINILFLALSLKYMSVTWSAETVMSLRLFFCWGGKKTFSVRMNVYILAPSHQKRKRDLITKSIIYTWVHWTPPPLPPYVGVIFCLLLPHADLVPKCLMKAYYIAERCKLIFLLLDFLWKSWTICL